MDETESKHSRKPTIPDYVRYYGNINSGERYTQSILTYCLYCNIKFYTEYQLKNKLNIITDKQLQQSNTSPNDLEIEKFNFKLDLPKVEGDKLSNSWSAAHQFLDNEEAKGIFAYNVL